MSSNKAHFLTVRRKVLLAGMALVALVGPVLAGSLQGNGQTATQVLGSPDHLTRPALAGPDRLGPTLRSYSLIATLRNYLAGSSQPSFQPLRPQRRRRRNRRHSKWRR